MSFGGFQKRYIAVYCLIFVLFVIIYYRLFDLQVLNRDRLNTLAEKQHNISISIPPQRGHIYDCNKKAFAVSLKVPSVYIVSRMIFNKVKAAQKLARILSLDPSFVAERLTRNKSFVWLKRNISKEEEQAIRALEDPNINILYERRRFYPQGSLLAQVLGFCNIDNEGLEGIELMHNTYLKGRPGFHNTKRDARGRKLVGLEDVYMSPVHGYDVVLTIDRYIQHIVEKALDEAFIKWQAASAMAIVMDPRNGRILAMANRPTFDLNAYAQANKELYRNRVVTDCYEPGSIFKIITAAAVLQEHVCSLADTFYCENGEYRFRRGRILHDAHPYGNLSFADVIIKSSNIGTVKMAEKLGEERLYEYMQRFGFGSLTSVDLPGEIAGIVWPPHRWSKISLSSIPIGQEVAVTPLQMVRALSVIANGGHLVTPYVVDEISDAKGITIAKSYPQIKRSIIDHDVASSVTTVLQRVVAEGTGKRAQIDGIPVAGKTGTAQKPLKGKSGYSATNYMSSFMGFAPADNPLMSVIVVLDSPRPAYYGGTVSAPVFKEIVENTLNYWGYVREEVDSQK